MSKKPNYKKQRHAVKIRTGNTLSAKNTAVSTVMALGLSFSAFGLETKQEVKNGVTQMPTVTVTSSKSKNGYNAERTSMPMYSKPTNEMPQTISIVPKQLIKDQGLTQTKDALRNVAGVSISAGEAGAGQGDNLTIRGFTARSDFFVDGIRDFGSYTRDPFNIEKIDVVKGPSSIGFGRGSTGGTINQETKQAQNENITDAQIAIGTDSTKRATVDINRKIAGIKGAAFRINAMTHENNVAERDYTNSKRWGIAPTVAFGIGSENRTTLSFLHQEENNLPDYGLPWIALKPATQSQINRSNYYGFTDGSNFFKTSVDMATAKFEHDFSENTTFRQQVRFADNKRNIRVTEPKTTGTSPTTVTRNQIAIESTETMLDSQTSVQTKFETGVLKHDIVAGIELIRETSTPERLTFTGVPTTSLLSPTSTEAFSGTSSVSTNVNTVTQTQAVFFNDTISPYEKIDIVLGGRIDRFTADYSESVAGSAFSRTDIMPAVRSSVVYKPQKDASVYANYGTSYNPSAEAFALTATTQNATPEMNATYEIGTKWGFFKNKLNTMFAVFQTKKTNARVTDPTNSLLTVNGGSQSVKGFETQINGQITEKLQVFSSYAYMQSEVLSSTNTNQVGNALANAPKHTLNLWGSYKLTPNFEFGAGANALSQRVASITEFSSTGGTISGSTAGFLKKADGYVTFNAMAKYQATPKISMQLNIYNITNAFYYDQLHPSHVIPGAGRTLLLTTNIKLD